MIRVTFRERGGTTREAEGTPGERLLDLAQGAGQPLEGTCGGVMACATCHVLVAPEWVGSLPPAGAEEESLLDLLPDSTARSRLACQILLTPAMAGLVVRIPPT